MGRYDLPDPLCNHAVSKRTVRVSSHADSMDALRDAAPLASVWVCEREACVEDAEAWVAASTRRAAVVIRT